MSEQSEPAAEPTEAEAPEEEIPEGAAPPLADDPILGDVRTDVVTIGPGNERTMSGAEQAAEDEKRRRQTDQEAEVGP